MINDDKKIADIIKIHDCLSRCIDDLRSAEMDSQNTGVLSQKQKFRKDLASGLVSADAGKEIAKKYGMLPGQEIGKYIDFLTSSNHLKLNVANKAIQSDMVMLIVCAAILFGEYEFLKDLETKTYFSTVEQSALSYLGQDVDWAYTKLAGVLQELSSGDVHFVGVNGKVARGTKHFECYYNPEINAHLYDMMLKLNAKLNAGTNILSTLFYVLWASTNYRYENGTSHIEHDWTMKTMQQYLQTVEKVFGKKYIIAPAVNLWTNKTLNILDADIAVHQKYKAQDKQRVETLRKQIVTYYDMLNPSAAFMEHIKTCQR
ncbi:MAG: hypothetical protein J5679_02520 [Alphaproteobacteria bacterium]|nr:hypothetical protein [Alphaproteobacteria bacterium]